MSKKTNAVNWFEIPVGDLNRATKFYQDILNVELTRNNEMPGIEMSMFPMDYDAIGATGALVLAEHYKPSVDGVKIYFHVSSINETVERISAAGGSISCPKISIGEHGFIAHFIDSEGNAVALHEGGQDC